MFRVKDTVLIVAMVGLPRGATIQGVVTAVTSPGGVEQFEVSSGEGENIETYTVESNQLRLIASAPPMVLDGATVELENGDFVAATITAARDCSCTMLIDTASRNRRRPGTPMDAADTYSYAPNPHGVEVKARQRGGTWYVSGTERKVYVGKRETVLKAVEKPAEPVPSETPAELQVA